jgi:hypothetical protein
MPKMGFEATVDALETGFQWPGTYVRKLHIAVEELSKYKLQKKRGLDTQYCSIWELAVGEQGGQLNTFYGHTMLEAAKKAFEWKTAESGVEWPKT